MGTAAGTALVDAYETERATLTERISRLGEGRLEQVLLSSSAEALAAWFADPDAR